MIKQSIDVKHIFTINLLLHIYTFLDVFKRIYTLVYLGVSSNINFHLKSHFKITINYEEHHKRCGLKYLNMIERISD